WRIVAPLAAARPVKDEAVRAFLEPLLAAEARDFTPKPLATTATRVRIATGDDEVVATVDGARARRANETVTLELAAPLALATSSEPARSRCIFPHPEVAHGQRQRHPAGAQRDDCPVRLRPRLLRDAPRVRPGPGVGGAPRLRVR